MVPQSFSFAISSSLLWGTLGKVTGLARHIVIAGTLGLSATIDAFFAATSIIAVFVFLIGAMMDVLSVPKLVEYSQDNDTEAFNRLGSSLFTFAVLLSFFLFVLWLLLLDVLPLFAIGFDSYRRGLLAEGLIWISPMILIYLPTRQLAALFRARGVFSVYYQAQFISSIGWLLFIVLFHRHPMVVFWAWPCGIFLEFLYLLWCAKKHFRLLGAPLTLEVRELITSSPALIVLQGLLIAHVAIDHIFASYLPTGGLGALSFAMVLISLPPGVIRLESSFISIYAWCEDGESRLRALNNLISVVLAVGIPCAIFFLTMGNDLIGFMLERGMFTSADTKLVTIALSAYSLSVIPMLLLQPVEQIFQVARRLDIVLWRALVGLVLNAVLCYVFLFQLKIGVVGPALAASISLVSTLFFSLSALRNFNLAVFWRKHALFAAWLVFFTLVTGIFLSSVMSTGGGRPVRDGSLLASYWAAVLLYLTCLPVEESKWIRNRLIEVVRRWG